MAETSPGPASSAKTVSFSQDYAELNQDTKDEKLCKEMVEVLGEDGHQRVLLTGKAGIGKTRLAKMVGEHATEMKYCFLTIWLNLNKDFDEVSLYENIASQLSVFLDKEESEEDDSEDEEEDQKTQDLTRLKYQILQKLRKKKAKGLLPEKKKAKGLLPGKKKAKGLLPGKKKAKGLLPGKKKAKGLLPGKKKAKGLLPEKKKDKDERKKYLLLVLDDVGSVTNEKTVMVDFGLEVFLGRFQPLKILLTRRKEERDAIDKMKSHAKDELHAKSDGEIESHATDELEASSDKEIEYHTTDELHAKSDEEIESHATDELEASSAKEIEYHATDGESVPPTGAESKLASKYYDEIEFSTTDMSEALLNTINETNLMDLFVSLIPEDWKTETELIYKTVSKSKNLPAAIVVLARSITTTSITTTSDREKEELKWELKKMIDEVLSADRSDSSETGSSSDSAVNPILYLGYVLLKFCDSSKGAILDCFWHSLSFFEHCGCVYYQDLIAHWILEGYFDPVRSVTEAYMDGHTVMMELIDRGILKIHEDNVVMPEVAMKNLIDLRRRGLSGSSRIALAKVFGSDRTQGLGKINQLDDIIEAVQTTRKGEKITTVLISGNRLRRETPEKFFEKLKDLEILGLFEPTVEPFVPCLSKLVKLRVLVIRDCDLLESIEDLKALTKLKALEVSGASSLEEISPEFFKAFLELQSLHLSGLKITSSPPSISELKKLHCLIIKDCPLLEDLPDIQELKELEVIDISGARGIKTCFDNTEGANKNKSQNKSFYLLTKLQLLDFSESQIERLPIFQDSAKADKLHSLTRLLLRNCSKLRRLPSLKPLSGLQILDLSGTTSLVKMLEVCFEDKCELRILNMSGTNLSKLATTIEELSSLNELLLRDCINLDAIPDIQKLENLEVIDVSGSTKLKKIEGSFENMSYLREVNLSGTKVETPVLPKETKILCLKRIFLADGRRFEGETWSKIKEDIERDRSENASSADAVVTSQEISEEMREIQSDEPNISDRTEMGDASKERLLQIPIERALYKKTLLSLVDSESPQEVMEINETNELDEDALANAEFVSFLDCTPTRLTSIFNKTKLVKRCWLRMCTDIKDLFYGVDEELLESLETLSITNLASLETISYVGKLENLKNLSLDCCPKIKLIFPEMPASLQVLNVKHCEKLEKVVEGVDLSTLTLTWKAYHCPKFEGNPKDSEHMHKSKE